MSDSTTPESTNKLLADEQRLREEIAQLKREEEELEKKDQELKNTIEAPNQVKPELTSSITFTIATVCKGYILANTQSIKQQKAKIIKTHSIELPYIDEGLQNKWFDFGGHAIIDTNKQIRLTSTIPSQQGYLWSRLPITSEHFEIEFEFKVGGSQSKLHGDGFAVWLTNERTSIGTVFGSVNRFTGLGVFFDTFNNEGTKQHEFPYISSMLGDGQTFYENKNDGKDTMLAGCQADFREKSFPTIGKLSYHKDNYVLLQVQWEEEGKWTDCFKVLDIKLPDRIYLGFTAHTGQLSDNHDIIKVTTRSLVPVEKLPKIKSSPVAKSGESSRLYLLMKMAVVGLVIGCLYFVYNMFTDKNQKRF